MADTVAWGLLRDAAEVYDRAPDLAQAARIEACRGFVGGGVWMGQALSVLRCRTVSGEAPGWLGIVKYGGAVGAALLWIACTAWISWGWGMFAIFVFYAVEAQMVFLFPLALDGVERPFRAARRWTVRAGGTLRVMATVMPIAAYMVFGGWFRQGFLRAWCVGCLAVCLWYERLGDRC